jgi:HAE1 family hydrophobic/amphiphilic exporter-1
LLVDYTNQLRRSGLEREEALLRAGPTRLRPILMTASAAILGMLPLALGLGKGSEIQVPMATAVIGGLMTSTFLTLLVIPTAYSVLDDLTGGHRHFQPPEEEKGEGESGAK